MKQRLSALRPGSPLDEQTLMGPLANRAQFEKVLQLIESAGRGRHHCLRRRSAARRRLFCLTDGGEGPERNSTLMQEETFGPVCSFIGYQSEEEALSRINASPFGPPPASGRRISARRCAIPTRLTPELSG